LTISQRPLTEAEKQASEVPLTTNTAPDGCISSFAHYGMYLVLIPMVGGGAIATILHLVLRVPEGAAYGIGFVAASCVSAFLFWSERQSLAGLRKSVDVYNQRRSEALQRGIMTVIEADVEAGWVVEEPSEGTTVGYLLRVEEGKFLYLSYNNQGLVDFDWSENGVDEFPGSHIVVDILPIVECAEAMAADGPPVALHAEWIPIEELPLTDYEELYAVLDAAAFSEEWRVKLAS
jgi:hypothetical protein